MFRPPVPLNDIGWFSDFFKAMGHFSLGAHELKEERLIAALKQLSSDSGYSLQE